MKKYKLDELKVGIKVYVDELHSIEGVYILLSDTQVHEIKCFLQALFPQKCRLTSSKLHGEFPHYCISSSGTLSGAGEESLQAYKVY